MVYHFAADSQYEKAWYERNHGNNVSEAGNFRGVFAQNYNSIDLSAADLFFSVHMLL